MSIPTDAAGKDVFDAAKAIVATLTGMQRPDQERALRYAADSLGLHVASPSTGPGTHPPEHPGPSAGAAPLQATAADRPTDIRSFVQLKQPKSENQYAAVVAYYYRFEAPEGQRQETINAESVQQSTRQSSWPRLREPRVTLVHAMNQGYLDRVDRGEYKINTVGENLVAMTLPGGLDGVGSAPRARGRRKRGARKGKGKSAARKRGRASN
jgi:hypothetical protein